MGLWSAEGGVPSEPRCYEAFRPQGVYCPSHNPKANPMRRTLWTLIPLWLGPVVGATPSCPTTRQQASPGLDELSEQYEEAIDAWRESIRMAANVRERSSLRKEHPAKIFLPRFRELAEAGQGRAWLWVADHLRDAGHKRKEAAALKAEIFTKLFEDDLDEDWFVEAIDALVDARKQLGPERVRRDLARAMGASASEPVRLASQLQLGLLLLDEESEGAHERALELLDELIEKHGQSEYGRQASARLFKSTYLVPHGRAIDFETRDAEGVAFKLSDYRGKVVLLDFWGFW